MVITENVSVSTHPLEQTGISFLSERKWGAASSKARVAESRVMTETLSKGMK